MNDNKELLPCPFCGTKPIREVKNQVLSIHCPECVSVGFANHVRFGCRADAEWNTRTKEQWISVKDSLPKEPCRAWCYVAEQGDLGLSHYQWNCFFDGEQFHSDGIITHWMPLPEPPTKEHTNDR